MKAKFNIFTFVNGTWEKTRAHFSLYVQVRGQLTGVGSLSTWVQVSIFGCQPWQQVPCPVSQLASRTLSFKELIKSRPGPHIASEVLYH